MAIPFMRDFDPAYGERVQVAPAVQRLVAPNPGPFTFAGTGVYIVGAGEEVCVIDPGPDIPDHREALWRALEGRRVVAVALTHHHLDHTPLARPLADAHGCEVAGMSIADGAAFESEVGDMETGLDEGADVDFRPDRELADGDTIAGEGFALRVLHTPGHTSNHLCFALAGDAGGRSALFTGDHVMGWSTTVVVPPDGSMRDYMASLRRVREGGFATLYPTHGAPIADPAPFLDAYRDHRLAREAKVRAALGPEPRSVTALVETVYADTNRALWPAASQSLRAHLIWLEEKGEAMEGPDGWSLA